MPDDTLELRPETDLAADYVAGSTGAVYLRDGARIERRHTAPCAGWYRIHPKHGAAGPFRTAIAARGHR